VALNAYGFSGWGRYTVEVARGARALGIEPVLVTAEARLDPSLEGVEHHAVLPPLFGRRFQTPRSLAGAPRLQRIIRTCQVVHCTVELYAPLVALARPRSVPYVQNAHGTWAIRPLESAVQRLLFAPAFRSADRLLVLSRFTRDWMARLMPLPPHEVLTGGVHPADFARDVSVSLPGWAADGPIVLSVGAVKPRKGIHVGLEAAAQARQAVPGLHYVVAGDLEAAGYVERLRKRAVKLGMQGYFHLIGQVPFDELVAWYRRADVFMLLPVNQGSSFEGLGLVYLEAGAAGTPSIGTLGCGAEEAVIDGETGLLVAQDDSQAAAAALARLLTDPGLRSRLAAGARARAERLSWANLAARVVAIYRELAAQPAGQDVF
jgi:glycosyltransferase involved in cell wall biosynthesis